MRGMLIVAACGALVGIPALARAAADPPATGEFTAKDDTPVPAWHANGGDAHTLTIVTHGTVTFSYPSGNSRHNITLNDPQPTACQNTEGGTRRAPWTASCRYDAPGTYPFECTVHPGMTGTVVVVDPTVATPTPAPAATPAPTPAPAPTSQPAASQSTLKVSLATTQRGRRLRGAVTIKGARSRLEVSVFAPRGKLSGGRSRTHVRIGHWTKASAPAGRVAFSVPISAAGRRALRRAHRLAVTVTVTLTPPGARRLTRTLRTTLRRTG